nr:PREDICTED: agamous-like MADS-box protein AGL29 [Nicotiana tabacum]
MARKKLRHTRICSESVRNFILKKRATSLFKKAEEFSIFCDVEVAIIIFSEGEIQPIAYPSIGHAKAERHKRLDKHETYLLEKVNEQEEKISKVEKMNEGKEMDILFNQLVEEKNINELDARQLKGLLKLSSAKMAKLNERKKQVIQPSESPYRPSDFKLNNNNNPDVAPATSLMDDLINDPWFVENMAANQNEFGTDEFCTEPAPEEGNDNNAGDDGNPEDLN